MTVTLAAGFEYFWWRNSDMLGISEEKKTVKDKEFLQSHPKETVVNVM